MATPDLIPLPKPGSNAKPPRNSYETALQSDPQTITVHNEDITVSNEPVKLTVDEVLIIVGTGKFQYILLVVAGLAFSGDAIEVSLLSFLSPCVQSSWGLSNVDAASLASAVFGGQMVGSVLIGSASDIYGRRVGYFAACWLVLIFGVFSCFAWNFESLLCSRAMVGVGIGGLTAPFNLLAEILQPSERGKFLLFIEYFWTLGSIYTTLVAYFTLSDEGWRVLAGLCALPVTVSLLAGLWLPESPRWLLLHNKPEEAKRVLMRVARMNGKENELPTVWELELIDQEEDVHDRPRSGRRSGGGAQEVAAVEVEVAGPPNKKKDSGDGLMAKLKKPLEVFETPELARKTLLIWIVWLAFGLTYYGVILLISRLFSVGGGSKDDDSSESCSFHSLSVVFASTSEFVGLTLVVFTIDSMGRRGSQAGFLSLGSLACLFIGIVRSDELLTVFSFLARGSLMAASSATWVAAPELYPTNLRATGHSLANTMARVGAFASPYIVDSELTIFTIAIIFAAMNMLSCMSVLILPETAGISLDGGDGEDSSGVSDMSWNQEEGGGYLHSTSMSSPSQRQGSDGSLHDLVVAESFNPITTCSESAPKKASDDSNITSLHQEEGGQSSPTTLV